MEKSPLQWLPAEIRVQIYADVVKGAENMVYLEDVPLGPDENDEPRRQLKYNSRCGITFTCRAIKAESTATMWSTATWVVERSWGYWLHHPSPQRLYPYGL